MSGELTVPRLVAAVTDAAPGFAMTEPTTEPTRPRAAIPRQVAPIGRPEWGPTVVLAKPPPRSQRRSLVLLVIAIVAMEAGVIVGRLLA
jgi:hypothetical protein